MEGAKSNWILITLGILFVVGLGVGGYYLGWYLDKQAAAKQAEQMKGVDKQFISSELGIKFTYPGDWKLAAINKDGTATTVTTESPNGSVFGYSFDSSAKGIVSTCDEDTPNGVTNGAKKCTFITSNPGFSRYNDSKNSLLWYIAEPAETTNKGAYLYKSSDSFYYELKSNSDLDALDKIMKTVVRTK